MDTILLVAKSVNPVLMSFFRRGKLVLIGLKSIPFEDFPHYRVRLPLLPIELTAKALANNNSCTIIGGGEICTSPQDPLSEENIPGNWVKLNLQNTLPSGPVNVTPVRSPQPPIEKCIENRE